MSKQSAAPSAGFDRKRAAIVAAAARLINSGSFTDMTLTALAAELGVKYTSFYHYFSGKDALAYATFAHSCALRLTALANTGDSNGFAQLADFIEADLSCPQVRLTHLQGLPEPSREAILRDVRRIHAGVAALIQQGIADGSIRHCEPQLCATVILDLLDRFAYRTDPLLPVTLEGPAMATALIDLLSGGLLCQDQDLSAMLKPQPDQLPDLAPAAGSDYARIDAMISHLTRAFNDHGIKGTSIPEQAAAMGVSKTVLYQVAASKEELAFYSMLRGLRILEVTGLIAEAMTHSPAAELTLWLRYINWVHYQRAGPIPFFDVLLSLSPHHLRSMNARYRAVQARFEALLDRATRANQIRELDLQILMRTLLCRPSLFWEQLVPMASSNTHVLSQFDQAMQCIWGGIAPE